MEPGVKKIRDCRYVTFDQATQSAILHTAAGDIPVSMGTEFKIRYMSTAVYVAHGSGWVLLNNPTARKIGQFLGHEYHKDESWDYYKINLQFVKIGIKPY